MDTLATLWPEGFLSLDVGGILAGGSSEQSSLGPILAFG